MLTSVSEGRADLLPRTSATEMVVLHSLQVMRGWGIYKHVADTVFLLYNILLLKGIRSKQTWVVMYSVGVR